MVKMVRTSLALLCSAIPLLVFACAHEGPHLQPAQTGKGDQGAKAAPSVTAAPSSSEWTAAATPDPDKAHRWAWSSIACWVGGAWSEALGALGEERVLATVRRCRMVATETLGAKLDDEDALAAVRGLDGKTVDRVVLAIEQAGSTMPNKAQLIAVVRATADASREAMMARRAAEAVRKDLSAKDNARLEKDVADGANAMTAKDALAKLQSLDAGKLSPAAKAIALVLAADHVEAARGLEPREKAMIASPAFEVVFGVARPKGDFKAGDWLAYVTATAKAAGHAPEESASTHDKEQSAFAGVVAGFQDKFEAVGKQLEGGEIKEVVAGYSKRLKSELAEASAKSKAKSDAKAQSDAAEEEQKKAEQKAPPKGKKK